MASQSCGLPLCGNHESSSDNVMMLSSSESEVIFYRFGFNIEYLCSKHHKDHFSRYEMRHNKKCADPCIRHAKPCCCPTHFYTSFTFLLVSTANKYISLRPQSTLVSYLLLPGQSKGLLYKQSL